MKTIPDWVKWVLVIVVLIVVFSFGRTICAVSSLYSHMPEFQEEMDTMVAADKLMREWGRQGFDVSQTKHLDGDPTEEQLIVEWEVSDPETGESWLYTWAYVPPEGMKINAFNKDQMIARLHEFEFVPVSEWAKGVHDQLGPIIENLTDTDRARFQSSHKDDYSD